MDADREIIMLKAELAATRQAADVLGLAWLQTVDMGTGLTVEEMKVVDRYVDLTNYARHLPDKNTFDAGLRQLVDGSATSEGLRLLSALGGFAGVHERAVQELQGLEQLLPRLPTDNRDGCRLVMSSLLFVLGLSVVSPSQILSPMSEATPL